MLDEEDREAALVAHPAHEVRGLGGLLRVHPRGRLVEEQELGVGGERACDLKPALVAVGEVGRHDVEHVAAQADVAQQLARLLGRLALLAPDARSADDGAEEAALHPRACWPTGTFSTAVIVANSRMFWNVRETPREVMMSGRFAVMSRPRKVTVPEVGV